MIDIYYEGGRKIVNPRNKKIRYLLKTRKSGNLEGSRDSSLLRMKIHKHCQEHLNASSQFLALLGGHASGSLRLHEPEVNRFRGSEHRW
jgi:hypothetical protein